MRLMETIRELAGDAELALLDNEDAELGSRSLNISLRPHGSWNVVAAVCWLQQSFAWI